MLVNMKPFYLLFSVLCLFATAQAFNLKSILFGDGNEGAQEGQKQSDVPFGMPITKRTASKRQGDNNACKYYVCEETQSCVKNPIDCPCRVSTDKKCYVGDWYTCVRGDENCDQLLS